MDKTIVVVTTDQGSSLQAVEVNACDLTEDEKAYLEFCRRTFDFGEDDEETVAHGKIFSGRDG